MISSVILGNMLGTLASNQLKPAQFCTNQPGSLRVRARPRAHPCAGGHRVLSLSCQSFHQYFKTSYFEIPNAHWLLLNPGSSSGVHTTDIPS